MQEFNFYLSIFIFNVAYFFILWYYIMHYYGRHFTNPGYQLNQNLIKIVLKMIGNHLLSSANKSCYRSFIFGLYLKLRYYLHHFIN